MVPDPGQMCIDRTEGVAELVAGMKATFGNSVAVGGMPVRLCESFLQAGSLLSTQV